MNRLLSGLMWAPLVLFGSLLALGAETDPSTVEEDPILLEYLEWKSDTGKTVARGLVVSRAGSDEFLTRTLVETPKDNHVVLTSKADWKEGELSVRFLDEEANWWSELVTTTSLRDLDGKDHQGIARGVKELQAGEAWEEESFLSCDGFWWRETVSPGQDTPSIELLPAVFAESEQARNVPSSAGEEASFLLAFSNSRELALAQDTEALLVTVMKAAGVVDLYTTQPWMVETPLGLEIMKPDAELDPLIANLLKEFRTVLAEDPLHDRR